MKTGLFSKGYSNKKNDIGIFTYLCNKGNYKKVTQKTINDALNVWEAFCLKIDFTSSKLSLGITLHWASLLGIIAKGATKSSPHKLVSICGIICWILFYKPIRARVGDNQNLSKIRIEMNIWTCFG